MTRWKLVIAIVGAFVVSAPLTKTASAGWFVHPLEGFKLWYPDAWYLEPWIPGETERFSIQDFSPDDPRFAYGRDPTPKGTAGIWLEVQSPEKPCRDVLEQKLEGPREFATWQETILGGRKYLLARSPGPFAVLHLACWNDEQRQYVFWLGVNPPHPRYKEVVATWEKVIASLELPPAKPRATRPLPTP